MKILIACEFSGIVRQAFRAKGHDAYSNDILDAEDNSRYHLKGDVRDHLPKAWDLLIAHPPCTHLAVSGARWFKTKETEQAEALDFIRLLMAVPYPYCIENPVSVISTKIRRPDQIIQPWQFGHGEVKATCLWLQGLPRLRPTDIVDGRTPRVHYASPGPDRWKQRSRTLTGIANAMADQWNEQTICAQMEMFP